MLFLIAKASEPIRYSMLEPGTKSRCNAGPLRRIRIAIASRPHRGAQPVSFPLFCCLFKTFYLLNRASKSRILFTTGFLASRSLKQDHTLTGFDKLKNPKRKAQYFSLFLFSRSTGLCHNEMQIFASRESTKRNTSNSFSQNQICFPTRSKYVPPREANLCFSWMQKKK